jgi:hypothetical protein
MSSSEGQDILTHCPLKVAQKKPKAEAQLCLAGEIGLVPKRGCPHLETGLREARQQHYLSRRDNLHNAPRTQPTGFTRKHAITTVEYSASVSHQEQSHHHTASALWLYWKLRLSGRLPAAVHCLVNLHYQMLICRDCAVFTPCVT